MTDGGRPLRDVCVGAATIIAAAAIDAAHQVTRERARQRVMSHPHACDNCEKTIEPIAEHYETSEDGAGWTLKCPVCNHEFGTVKEWWYDERHV